MNPTLLILRVYKSNVNDMCAHAHATMWAQYWQNMVTHMDSAKGSVPDVQNKRRA